MPFMHKNLFGQELFDIVLMDIGLPDGNGIDLVCKWRKLITGPPSFVFLSAYNDPQLRVRGLEIGACDYLAKPFALKELLLRLKRILISNTRLKSGDHEITHGPLKIWFMRYAVKDANGQVIDLGTKAINILAALYYNAGAVVSREELLNQIWGEGQYPSNRTIDNYIVTLRKWCETDPNKSIQISSVRGVGYKLILNS